MRSATPLRHLGRLGELCVIGLVTLVLLVPLITIVPALAAGIAAVQEPTLGSGMRRYGQVLRARSARGALASLALLAGVVLARLYLTQVGPQAEGLIGAIALVVGAALMLVLAGLTAQLSALLAHESITWTDALRGSGRLTVLAPGTTLIAGTGLIGVGLVLITAAPLALPALGLHLLLIAHSVDRAVDRVAFRMQVPAH